MKYEYDFCPDCGTDVLPDTPPGTPDWQRYMVYDHIWTAADLDYAAGWFCIPCLETRLGRPLTGADLPPYPINDPDRDDDTPRLRALKQAVAELHPDGDWLLRNRLAGVDPPAPRLWRLRDAALEVLATVQHWLRLP